jgi:hypothetical protein
MRSLGEALELVLVLVVSAIAGALPLVSFLGLRHLAYVMDAGPFAANALAGLGLVVAVLVMSWGAFIVEHRHG